VANAKRTSVRARTERHAPKKCETYLLKKTLLYGAADLLQWGNHHLYYNLVRIVRYSMDSSSLRILVAGFGVTPLERYVSNLLDQDMEILHLVG
jgi:hypothetical protein